MKLIITGATGFIGRNLAESLARDGQDVLATGRALGVGNILGEAGIEFRPADIGRTGSLIDVFEPADCVIHCAGKSGDWGIYDDFHHANVKGTRNVLQGCIRHGIGKLIFISSPSVYFNDRDRLELQEDDLLPVRQLSHYATTKLIAEKEVLAARAKGIEVINLRPKAVFGPHDNTFSPRILRMSQKRRFPLINNGRALVDITFIENFVDAVRLCLKAPENAWNETYNISNGSPITIREWFEKMLAIFGKEFKPMNVPVPAARAVAGIMELAGHFPFGPKKPAMTRYSVGYMARSMTLSIEKARKRLGYGPRLNNAESFNQYREWYARQDLNLRPTA